MKRSILRERHEQVGIEEDGGLRGRTRSNFTVKEVRKHERWVGTDCPRWWMHCMEALVREGGQPEVPRLSLSLMGE